MHTYSHLTPCSDIHVARTQTKFCRNLPAPHRLLSRTEIGKLAQGEPYLYLMRLGMFRVGGGFSDKIS